jgi:hypothetical protein
MDWLQRLEHQYRKQQRRARAHNMRTYRKRKAAAGYRRIDVALGSRHYRVLCEQMQPGESFSAAICRLLDAATSDTEIEEKYL